MCVCVCVCGGGWGGGVHPACHPLNPPLHFYDLKNDKSIVIKDTDKGSVLVVWDREESIKKVGDKNVYD